MRDRRRATTGFVVAVTGLAAAAVALGATRAVDGGVRLTDVALLFALHLVADIRPLDQFRGAVEVTLCSIILVAAIMIVGPAGGVLVALAAFFTVERNGMLKRLFNGSQFVLATGVAGLVYVGLGGTPGSLGTESFPEVLVPAGVASIAFAAVNALLIASVVSLSSGRSMWLVLREGLLPSAPPYLAYGAFGLVLATLWLGGDLGVAAALLLLAPLAIARWVYSQYAAEHEAYEATVRTFVQAVETKDLYTRGHSERVAHGSVLIGRELGLREDRLESLRYAGLLHDLGKVGVATRILHKTERLEDDEFAAIRRHPERGVQMTGGIEFLDEARQGIRHHHERMDGRGYPSGLVGMQIPEFARVICVADAFDAMTTVRSYRGARPPAEAVAELQRGSGSQFDPDMVTAFLTALDEHGWDVPAPPVVPAEAAAEAPSSIVSDHDDPRMSVPDVRRRDADGPDEPPGDGTPRPDGRP